MDRKLVCMLILIGLTAGCAAPSRTFHSPERPALSPTLSDTPDYTGEEDGVTVEPTEPATLQATPGVTPSPGPRPPAVEDLSTVTPVEAARADLARRLNADVHLVEVADVTRRAADPDEMPCLAEGLIPEGLWTHADAVQWIALSVKGNIHHYVALGDLVVYCEE